MSETIEKKVYVKPATKEEAISVLKALPIELYNRIKGRGLGLVEKWYPTETNRAEQQMARDSYLLMISGIMSSITKKIEDSIQILEQK
jgi:hypothetical protein